MTLQEFSKLHPDVIHYERAGVDGIDFDALHKKIEQSKYLKSRRSFVYLAKNYNSILAGAFDDFKLSVPTVEDEKQAEEEKIKNELRRRLGELQAFKLDSAEIGFFKEETGMTISEMEEVTRTAIGNKSEFFRKRAEEAYRCFKEYEKNRMEN